MKVLKKAEVTKGIASGAPGAYTFGVTVNSPETGCDQYADWREVVSEDGRLISRRTRLHSHVGEQPFTRSGRQVPVSAGEVMIVRAHMNTSGYENTTCKGSAWSGFSTATLPGDFASRLESLQPQPCAF